MTFVLFFNAVLGMWSVQVLILMIADMRWCCSGFSLLNQVCLNLNTQPSLVRTAHFLSCCPLSESRCLLSLFALHRCFSPSTCIWHQMCLLWVADLLLPQRAVPWRNVQQRHCYAAGQFGCCAFPSKAPKRSGMGRVESNQHNPLVCFVQTIFF